MLDRKRERGSGRVYQRGQTYWIQYSVLGHRFRESANSTDRRDADRLLRRRLGEAAIGRHAPQVERVTFEHLASLVVGDYEANARRSLPRLKTAIKHLRGAFGCSRAVAITGDRLTAYVGARLDEQAARATVCYELAALRRGFNLAIRAGRLVSRPYFPMLSLDNARQGFVGDSEFEGLASQLSGSIQGAVRFAFLTGWRLRSEVLSLTWDRVDFEAGEVRLHTSKNGEPRVFPFDALPELSRVLSDQLEATRSLERSRGAIIPYVFHRNGQPIRDLRGAWGAACRKAGIVGLIPHDLRRSAVRRLERAGVPRAVAMQLTGHRTEAVYRRYAIVARNDLTEGVAKLAGLAKESIAPTRVLQLRTGTTRAQ